MSIRYRNGAPITRVDVAPSAIRRSASRWAQHSTGMPAGTLSSTTFVSGSHGKYGYQPCCM
jgi:hypothetical protein